MLTSRGFFSSKSQFCVATQKLGVSINKRVKSWGLTPNRDEFLATNPFVDDQDQLVETEMEAMRCDVFWLR
jgi:hypothetical protein